MTGVLSPVLTLNLQEIGGNSLILHFNALCYFITGFVSLLLEKETHVQDEVECVPLKHIF